MLATKFVSSYTASEILKDSMLYLCIILPLSWCLLSSVKFNKYMLTPMKDLKYVFYRDEYIQKHEEL